jgi:hypothetical protein
MTTPIFAVATPCFLGQVEEEDRNIHISKHAGEKSLFGKIKRFYIHGELEDLAGFDICEFIAGDFIDKRQQPAQLLLSDGTLVDCQILMATSDKGNKFAFLISSTSVNMEENRAWHSLYVDGEWLKHGKEI